ncbi:MAG: glycosyltransferase family 4 protein [Candidatus Omnitrophota bacterium]
MNDVKNIHRRMKILVLLTDGFGCGGGIAKYNRDLLNALCAYPACKEVVAIPRLMTGEPGRLPSKLTYLTTGIGNKLKYIKTVLFAISKKGPFDLIISGHIHLVPLAIVLKWLLCRPVILIIYGVDAWQPTKRHIVDFLVAQTNIFITISEFSKQKFLQWTHLKQAEWYLVPPCIEQSLYGEGPKNLLLVNQYDLNGKSLLFTLARLSSLDRYKGIDEVIEVMPALLKEVPSLVYLIGGDGSDRGRLEDKVKKLGLTKNVFFAGYIPETQKPDYYRLADAFVMPGWGEGFGITYLEALACGIPVVGSRLDASYEAISHCDIGIAVDPTDPEDLKKGIRTALKCRQRSVPVSLNDFSYQTFQARIHQVLDDIFKSHSFHR